MNISKYLLITGVLTFMPALASADRYCGDRQNFSRPTWSDNNFSRPSGSYWGRPYQNYQNSYSYGSNSFGGRTNADSLIQSGIQTGRLSNAEVRELREKQRDLWQDQRSAWSDGHLSNSERKDIRGDYEDFYNDLNHELNDGERIGNRNSFWRW